MILKNIDGGQSSFDWHLFVEYYHHNGDLAESQRDEPKKLTTVREIGYRTLCYGGKFCQAENRDFCTCIEFTQNHVRTM